MEGGSARDRLSCHHLLVEFAFNAKSFAVAILVFFLLFFILVPVLDGLTKVVGLFLFYICFRCV